MKIIAGSCRGMPLCAPKGAATRPTSAKVREAVMSMLASVLPEARFLDLFAGSGAMGCEALSRGAKACLFVEWDRQALSALRSNVDELKRRLAKQGLEEGKVEILSFSMDKALGKLAQSQTQTFDIIWADPPYKEAQNWVPRLSSSLVGLASADALWLMEAPREIAQQLGGLDPMVWSKVKEKLYGDTMIIIWQRKQVAI